MVAPDHIRSRAGRPRFFLDSRVTRVLQSRRIRKVQSMACRTGTASGDVVPERWEEP